jgi:hypothetical protein
MSSNSASNFAPSVQDFLAATIFRKTLHQGGATLPPLAGFSPGAVRVQDLEDHLLDHGGWRCAPV